MALYTMMTFWRVLFTLPKTQANGIIPLLEDVFMPCSVAVGKLAEGKEPTAGMHPVELLFQEKPDIHAIEMLLLSQGAELEDGVRLCELPDQDWIRASLRDLHPLQIGPFWVYGSHCPPKPAGGVINLEVDAGLAFGTGHHETTTGCLQALHFLSKQIRPRHVIDIGTGTGILAMAAHKLWGIPVKASDIDHIAVAVTRENIRKNKMSGYVHAVTAPGVRHQAITHGAPYDLIIANILARPLVSLAPDFGKLLTKQGIVVLAGLLTRQINYVRDAYRLQGFYIWKTFPIGEWTTLVLRRHTH